MASELKRFEKVYEDVIEFLTEDIKTLPMEENVRERAYNHYRRCLPYSSLGGKLTRGLTVVKAAEAVLKPEGVELSDAEWTAAATLGVCVELLQTYFLVADDVMDSSHLRRNKPCWFRLEGIGAANAINDALFIESCIYKTLKKYFSDHPGYYEFVQMFHTTTFRTIIGQHIDTNSQPHKGPLDVTRITRGYYEAQVTYKTAFYSFCLPCALGLHFGGLTDEALHSSVESVCIELGRYFQKQDDVLDCFAPPEILGKIGTDIQEKKCSWLLVRAMELVNSEDRQTLIECVGIDDAEKVQKVKDVYIKYKLKEDFQKDEDIMKPQIERLIENVPHAGIIQLLQFLLGKVYKRHK